MGVVRQYKARGNDVKGQLACEMGLWAQLGCKKVEKIGVDFHHVVETLLSKGVHVVGAHVTEGDGVLKWPNVFEVDVCESTLMEFYV